MHVPENGLNARGNYMLGYQDDKAPVCDYGTQVGRTILTPLNTHSANSVS